jgi:hypothetical protein
MRLAFRSRLGKLLTLALLALCATTATAQQSVPNVTTHHYDNFRTGWNWQETVLAPANVNANNFTLTATLYVDDQVDAQPLIYNNVLYIATESNSVYAFNATTGAQLNHVTLGLPITGSMVGCDNNGPNIGINSTPVIDTATNTLYVVATTASGGNVLSYLHALNVSTLGEQANSPLLITLPPNTVGRQRAALTLFNGGVLIPFSTFCDRTNTQGFIAYANANATPPQVNFVTSISSEIGNPDGIWMSGGGAAVSGNTIYFMTGNGGYAPGLTPSGAELPQAMVALTGSAAGQPLSLTFAGAQVPNTGIIGFNNDADYAAGGVLVIPSGAPSSITSATPAAYLAGAGKLGQLYTFVPSSLASGTIVVSQYLQSLSIGNCWCGESYFTGGDGLGHVVTSTSNGLQLYPATSGGLGYPISAMNPPPPKSAGDPGFWTTVSSNGTAAGTGIIWAVAGPDSYGALNLYAYNATNLSQMFATDPLLQAPAGWWPNSGGNANIVPVVSNGRVYVASSGRGVFAGGQVTIWSNTAGPLPSPPDSVGMDIFACPYARVTWDASAGATSYQLYIETGLAWQPGGSLLYSGPNLQKKFRPVINQNYLFKVAACNSSGCSPLSSSTGSGSMPAVCP